MPKPKRKLTELSLNEVSSCKAGDDPEARILLVKNSGDEPDDAGQPGGSDNEGVTMSAINKALGLPESASEAEALAAIAGLNQVAKTAQKAQDAANATIATLEKKVGELETIEKARAEDESFVNLDGETITKSAVGAASFNMLKSMNDRMENAELEKSAAVDYPNLKSDVVVKALRVAKRAAVKEDGETISELLKRNNELVGLAITKNGRKSVEGEGATEAADDKLDKMAKARATEKGETYAVAYKKVLQTPEGRALYEQTAADSTVVQ